jgi:hypothetical protein
VLENGTAPFFAGDTASWMAVDRTALDEWRGV